MTSLVKNVVQHWSSPKRHSTAQIEMCEICGKRPKFVEQGYKHSYCSRTCAAKSAQGPAPTACLLQGCRSTGKPAFTGFCSEAHAKEGVRLGQVKGCSGCKTQPSRNGDLCLSCERRSQIKTSSLREVRNGSNLFNRIRQQFHSEWDSLENPPTLEKVFEVVLPRDARTRHEQYRSTLFSPIEIRTFHSSQCICDMGTKDPTLCDFKSCGVCSIVKSSFRAFAFEAAYNTGRFGDGIYSYRNPALADRYATSCTSSPYRVTIACDTTVESTIQVPDEESVFVPKADAIIPAYILMYIM